MLVVSACSPDLHCCVHMLTTCGNAVTDQSTYCHTLAGSTFADRTAKALDLIGDTPLHEAAERYPADALRVFMRRHHRTYTDESPVCNAGPAEPELIEICIPLSFDICQVVHPACLSSCPQEAAPRQVLALPVRLVGILSAVP